MLVARLATAIVGIPLILVVIWFGGLAFTLAAIALAFLAAGEAAELLQPAGPGLIARVQSPDPSGDLLPPRGKAPVLLTAPRAAALLVAASHFGLAPAFGALALILGALACEPLFASPGGSRWETRLAAALYAGLPLALLIQIRDFPIRGLTGPPISLGFVTTPLVPGLAWTLLLLTTVWGVDTVAYTIGRAFGRRPFWPRVSPKKTWEGTIAGLLAGPLIWLAWAGPLQLAPLAAIGAGFLTASAAILGDLAESALKRSAGAKDSGSLLPGHGGLLDRLDSLGFATVVVFLYVILVST